MEIYFRETESFIKLPSNITALIKESYGFVIENRKENKAFVSFIGNSINVEIKETNEIVHINLKSGEINKYRTNFPFFNKTK